MQTNKIEGKFYPLQHEEWVKACKELSAGARDVLYYIRTADPYSNGIEVSAAAIARDMGVNRSTISRALKELDAKGYAGVEILTAKVCITGKGLLAVDDVAETQPRCKNATPSANLQQSPQKCNNLGKNATRRAKLQQASSETVAVKEFQVPKTSSDSYKTNQTLSEATRERNLTFWNELDRTGKLEIQQYAHSFAIPRLPTKPTLVDSWIMQHCMELFNQLMVDSEFQKLSLRKSSGNSPTVENEEEMDW